MKKNRACSFPDVDKCVKKWFEQYCGEGVPISGLMLQKKAEDFAKELGLSDFKASNGRLESFKMRHDIVFRKLGGESASVPTSVIEDWLQTLPSLLQGYDPADIFNTD